MSINTILLNLMLASTSPAPEIVREEPLAVMLADPADVCSLSAVEANLMARIIGATEQRRSHLRCSGTLQRFARSRGMDMAARDYFSHVNPERTGPNQQLRDAGYPLPSLYGGVRSNNVESIAAGIEDVDHVVDELLRSRDHRAHLLGEGVFYAEQDEIGVAHVYDENSEYGDYWVIIIARRERPDEPRYLCTPEPTICFVSK